MLKFLRDLTPTAKTGLSFLGLMVLNDVGGRATVGKPFHRLFTDPAVRMLGGNRRLFGS